MSRPDPSENKRNKAFQWQIAAKFCKIRTRHATKELRIPSEIELEYIRTLEYTNLNDE